MLDILVWNSGGVKTTFLRVVHSFVICVVICALVDALW